MNKFIFLTFIITIVSLSTISCESGVCSWYGIGLDGAYTASGEKYDHTKLTAAHKTLPFGTMVRATCNGKSVVVRVNDRGPFVAGRILDLSIAGADVLGIRDAGICSCSVDKV
ncbi:probable endolytic peptidoglycan transglycosylase RlpA [Oppia nitens]|uniref:probable endolytic peptidoglycan transglycosylase RlpA n=1 Tax=Oppia nitens TaxID=1686743 RepID=UPI0023D9CD34|nr:probable endolytic peptidoglycan transglycosylase RlpA [Oppia nitens]